VIEALGFLAAAAALALLVASARSWFVRQQALKRLYDDELDRRSAVAFDLESESALTQWLARAGYRSPDASAGFVAATVIAVVTGLVAGQIYRAFFQQALVDAVIGIPGSLGDVMAAVLQGGPLVIFVLFSLAPTLVVRTARRTRVQAIERDLPLALELFATMAEAGLGFDAALAKIVRAQTTARALASEFITFQHDMLAGVPRSQALRQLARRVDMAALTSFTSALIQAEHVGASMSETLQHQADDLRQRRREEALLQAQALPVKLVFPLVICFLPGIFVSTLAPVIQQMIQVADSVLRSSVR
jgi:tight adherence protein C